MSLDRLRVQYSPKVQFGHTLSRQTVCTVLIIFFPSPHRYILLLLALKINDIFVQMILVVANLKPVIPLHFSATGNISTITRLAVTPSPPQPWQPLQLQPPPPLVELHSLWSHLLSHFLQPPPCHHCYLPAWALLHIFFLFKSEKVKQLSFPWILYYHLRIPLIHLHTKTPEIFSTVHHHALIIMHVTHPFGQDLIFWLQSPIWNNLISLATIPGQVQFIQW